MKNALISAAMLFAAYKLGGKSAMLKTAIIAVAAVKVAAYVPYVNNQTPKNTIDMLKAAE